MPGPTRPLPPVAGMNKQQVEAMASSVAPPFGRPAGPQGTPITKPAMLGMPQISQVNGLPSLKDITAGSYKIPLWGKILLVTAGVAVVGAITWKIVDHRRRMRSLPDYDF